MQAADAGSALYERLRAFNMEVATAINTLDDQMHRLVARVISSETAHRSLVNDAQRVLGDVVAQAKAEFASQAQQAQDPRASIPQIAMRAVKHEESG